MEIKIPDIGDFSEVEVIEVLVKPGDEIAAEAPLLVLESDKATMDVPSPGAGKITAVHVQAGDKVREGTLIAEMDSAQDAQKKESGETTKPAAETVPPAQPKPEPPPQPSSPPASAETVATTTATPAKEKSSPLPAVKESKSEFAKVHAGPAARRFARELGVDLAQVRGSARLGRVIKEDVKAFVKAQMHARQSAGAGLPEMPEADFSRYGEVEIHPLSRVRKLSAVYLRRNWLIAPHVTQFAEADITEMDAFRRALAADSKQTGYKITPLAFLLKAAAAALREFPRFNASLAADGENLIVKKYIHIGVAVDTPQGLVVPVLRDVEQKGVADLARELAETSARAREGKLSAEDMRGGCFTISSLGGIGGAHFTPILNLPEAAILGVGRAETKPLWNGKEFAPRLMLPLALSYDHRIIDGADGARFVTFYANLLTDTRRLAL